MKKIIVALFAIALMAPITAHADDKVSEAEGKAIQSAISAWGCKGGDMEKESEGTGVFEVDDADCPGGQYDIKLSADNKVISISRD